MYEAWKNDMHQEAQTKSVVEPDIYVFYIII